ncbi:MAG TPA: MFS transporter [Terriglobales bacterium]|nr:MFS transporter [Terriglobales bacterium]
MAPKASATMAGGSKHRFSPWGPFREPVFRSLWIAAVISYTGTWMQNLGSGWLMTSLSMSPLMVSLVQVASSLPVFLVALPAGALADLVDRRRLLIVTQTWMVIAAAALGVITVLHLVTAWLLLLFTFFLGLGAVMNDPAWQAITPEIISGEQHASAVALNSAGYNVARAIGPALGGAVIAAAGSGVAFLINAASFFGVIFFLCQWKRKAKNGAEGGRIWGAMKEGIAYVRQSPAVKAVLVRTLAVSLSASALLALLPIIARPHGAIGYGLLLGSFGLGALAGAAILPRIRSHTGMDNMVGAATVVFAVVTFAAGQVHWFALLGAVLFLGGVAWITILACLNVTAQTMSPPWVLARSLSMYILVLQGGVAAGSVIWGAVAEKQGVPRALMYAALGLVLGLISMKWHRLRGSEVDLAHYADAGVTHA